jgi:hypothetical protein
MPPIGGHCRRPNLIPPYDLSDPRIGAGKRLVDGFLHMIENDQPDCGKDDGSNASNKKGLDGVLPSPI